MSNSLRKVDWYMSDETYVLYLAFAEVASASEEGTDQYNEAIEGLKSLPGYPLECDGDDGIVFVPKDLTTVTVSVLH